MGLTRMFSTGREKTRPLFLRWKNSQTHYWLFWKLLTNANDKEAIIYCAQRRPQWSFVLIGGPCLGDYTMMKNYPNIYMLPKKPHSEIPHYGRYFDVALRNWKPHDWITHCFPVKSIEYLALGLPIVSVAIEEVKIKFGDLVHFAGSPDEYLKGIEKCLMENGTDQRQLRLARIAEETWDSKVEELRQLDSGSINITAVGDIMLGDNHLHIGRGVRSSWGKSPCLTSYSRFQTSCIPI